MHSEVIRKVLLGDQEGEDWAFFSVNGDSLFINGCNCRVAL